MALLGLLSAGACVEEPLAPSRYRPEQIVFDCSDPGLPPSLQEACDAGAGHPDPSLPQSIDVKCIPSPVVRGQDVTCRFSVLPPRKIFNPRGTATSGSNVAYIPFTQLNDQVLEATGPAIFSSTVAIDALVDDGSGTVTSEGGNGGLTVLPRQFSSLSFPDLPLELPSGPNPRVDERGNIIFGVFVEPDIDPMTVHRMTVTDGPNNGYTYLLDTPQPFQPLVF